MIAGIGLGFAFIDCDVSNQPTLPDSIATAQDPLDDKTLRNALVSTVVVTVCAIAVSYTHLTLPTILRV